MATKVLVPQLGESVDEVTIVNWLKAEGDQIEKYEDLIEVETDKVVTVIPSPIAGTLLKIEIPTEGEVVSVGTILAWIGEPGESIEDSGNGAREAVAAPIPVKAEVSAPSPTLPSSPNKGFRIGRDEELGFISPLVAKLSSEHNIDLTLVNGTGLKGRITKNDVLAYVDSPSKTAISPTHKPSSTQTPGTLVPHTLVRRRIAEHMVMSRKTSPHVTTVMEADFSKVIAHRKSKKDEFARDGVKLTFTAYFVAAAAEALRAFPIINASWSDEGTLMHPDVNIGMATDLGADGLIVPVIKNADDLSLLGISRSVNDLAECARANKLAPGEVQGGTFTITNHGISGSLFAAPIINQPQAAILGVGAIQKRVIVVTDDAGNDAMAIRPMVYLSLTIDHRILDGAVADHFLARLIESLEGW